MVNKVADIKFLHLGIDIAAKSCIIVLQCTKFQNCCSPLELKFCGTLWNSNIKVRKFYVNGVLFMYDV